MTFSRGERATEDLAASVVGVALLLLLLSPYLVGVFPHLKFEAVKFGWEWVAIRGAGQALASTVGSLVAGWFLFRALRATPAERRAAGELRLLLPNVVPPLFLALALISLATVVTPSGMIPFGTSAVVIAHVLLYGGLAAVAFERIERARLGQLAEVAWTLDVPERTFWTRLAWPLVRRDVTTVSAFIFVLCFTSVSLPLLLQGARNGSIEVAILDLIRIDGRVDLASVLATVQAAGLALISLALSRGGSAASRPAREPRTLAYRGGRRLGLLTWAPVAVLIIGSAGGFTRARWPADPGEVAWATLGSLTVAAAVGAMSLILFTLVTFATPRPWLDRVLLGYVAPGPALAAFAFVATSPAGRSDAGQLLSLAGALTLTYFAPLYRWHVRTALAGLRDQRAVARTLGAGHWQITREIAWPQAAPALLGASGLAAAWAAGDFVLAGILLDQPATLPQLIASRVARYRWGEAMVLLIPLGVAAAAPYLIYRRFATYVRS